MACYDALMLATMTIVMLVVMLLMTRMIAMKKILMLMDGDY